VEETIPGYVMREIRRIMSVRLYKRLIACGMELGEDFSVDARATVLTSDRAKSELFS
jgi:hypothetical protein